MRVHVAREVAVHGDDEADSVELKALPALALDVPCAVRFERAREHEAGEVKLGGSS